MSPPLVRDLATMPGRLVWQSSCALFGGTYSPIPPGVCRRAAGGRGRRLGRSFLGGRSLGDQGLEQREVLTGAGLDLVS